MGCIKAWNFQGLFTKGLKNIRGGGAKPNPPKP